MSWKEVRKPGHTQLEMYVKMGLTDGAHGTTEKIAKTISCLVDRTFWVRQVMPHTECVRFEAGAVQCGGKRSAWFKTAP